MDRKKHSSAMVAGPRSQAAGPRSQAAGPRSQAAGPRSQASGPGFRGPEILFEDGAILVVDKPAGMIVHPAPGHETGALTEWAVRRFPAMARVGSAERPGVVHRLDLETSGVLVLAKTQAAYLDLRRQFESHRDVRKTYLAVCHLSSRALRGTAGAGGPPSGRAGIPAKGTIDSPVGRERLRAVTHYEILARRNGIALVRFDIETGRMHQIRIHAKELGMPLLGDTLYGDAARDRTLRVKPRRLLLHAVELSLVHPVTGKRVTFVAPPPADIVYAV